MTSSMNLPGIIIVGAQKCGTGTLHGSLIKHSGIDGPVDPTSNLLIKEVDFFYSEEKWKKGIDWYSAHFKGTTGMFLDSSPNYLAKVCAYKRIHEVVPEAKLIVCLRSPVDRAYSQYNHYRQDMPRSLRWDCFHN